MVLHGSQDIVITAIVTSFILLLFQPQDNLEEGIGLRSCGDLIGSGPLWREEVGRLKS